MILITGGAYQGKLDYAKEEFGLTDDDVFTCEETSTAVGFDEKIVYHFERYVLALIKAGQVPEKAVGMQLRANRYKGRIVICDDISQGLVPMEQAERAWREGVGRTMVKMAEQADKVVRVFCGIPEVIKDDTAGAANLTEGKAPEVKSDGLEAVFASEKNGAVKAEPEAPEAEVKQADKPHGIGGRGQGAGPRTPFGQPGQVAIPHKAPGENGADEGLTPEEQFRKMFAKMQEERKAAKKDQE